VTLTISLLHTAAFPLSTCVSVQKVYVFVNN